MYSQLIKKNLKFLKKFHKMKNGLDFAQLFVFNILLNIINRYMETIKIQSDFIFAVRLYRI